MSDPLNVGNNPLIPDDRFVRNVVRTAVHVRRHLPLYVIGLAVLLVALLVPTVALSGSGGTGGTGSVASGGVGSNQSGGTGVSGSGSSGAQTGPSGTSDLAGGTGSVSAAGGSGSGASSGYSPGSSGSVTGGGANSPASNQPVGQVHVGSGVTVGGFKCSPGVNQVPWSSFAAPCQAAFSGYNGGATSRGVTASTILVADRDCPQSANSAAANQFALSAGVASPAVLQATNQIFINYFQKAFDLYGRHVVLQPYHVSGSSTECTLEAESQGQDNACADADGIANTVKAFGEDGLGVYSNGGGPGGSQPFSQCAAGEHLVEFEGASYFPQTYMDQLSPYVWNLIMGCDRIAELVGQNLVQSYLNQDAKWSGSTLMQHQKRVLGTYVPNNPGYQDCVQVYDNYIKAHGDNDGYAFNYVLDISRFADQASEAIVQFHAEGVTTVVLACDPISPIFLTEEADSQNYFPEWYSIGVAGNDADTVPRLWDAKEITGHLFGLSQLGPTQSVEGPLSEPGITYQKITGKPMPAGAGVNYFQLVQIFDQLQAAGPILTPLNLAKGSWSLPQGGAVVPGGSKFPFAIGATCFCTNWKTGAPGEDHTWVEDTRETYWDNNGTSPYDGKAGTYIQIWSGARFKVNDLPSGPPPFYPPACNPECTTPPPDQPPPPGPHDGG